jgi:NAD(P)-dependent dehydrogenase (short-subunit alcohol dehydrogenase family)
MRRSLTRIRTSHVGRLPPRLHPETRKWILDRIPLGRGGTVEEVAQAVVFLASPAASLVTGSSLLVDGGWTAW